MKSLSLYQCDMSGGSIIELARDYNAHWMTSVAFLDDDTYLGAENSHNLFVARKNADAATDDATDTTTAAVTASAIRPTDAGSVVGCSGKLGTDADVTTTRTPV